MSVMSDTPPDDESPPTSAYLHEPAANGYERIGGEAPATKKRSLLNGENDPGPGRGADGNGTAEHSAEARPTIGRRVAEDLERQQAIDAVNARTPESLTLGKRITEYLEAAQAADAASTPESLTLEEMLERFVHVARGPLIVDASNTYRRLRSGEFRAAYAHNKVVIENEVVPVTVLWSQSERRMAVDRLTFDPGKAQFFTELGLRHFNIWSPPAWPATDIAAAAPFVEHLQYLIPDACQREDLLDWLAHSAQRPEVRPHFHLLLVATHEGTGRSWLAEVLRRMWGERHAAEVDLHRLLDDPFNSVLSGKILVAAHEVRAPADERYSHRDRLKGLLTDTSITLNEKHERRWTERFCARFLMFTNRDDALPLSESDRRVYVVRCADKPRDKAYYTSLYGKVEDPELLAGVWQLLRTRDISSFNPGQQAPLNEIKRQMIASGRTDEQQTAVEFVKTCPYSIVAANDLMRVLVPEKRDEPERDRRARMNAVAAVLREVGMQASTQKIWMEGRATRLWILRNAVQWSAATAAGLREEAQKARQDIIANHDIADDVIDLWQGMRR
ncbi:MAG TPA: DUF5906 domain-containing protein [Steroidobacteraceae bacterium]